MLRRTDPMAKHMQFVKVAAAEAQVRLDRVAGGAADMAPQNVQFVKLPTLDLANGQGRPPFVGQQQLLGA